jgi:hypothetical protein
VRRAEVIAVPLLLALSVFLGVGAINTLTDGRGAPQETAPWLTAIALLAGFLWFGMRQGVLPRWIKAIRDSGRQSDVGDSQRRTPPQSLPPNAGIGRYDLADERSVVIATEDVPLDNRHGNSTLTSEHEFSHTATSSLRLDRQQELGGHLQAGAWSLLEAQVQAQVSKSLGIEVGQQITRRVVLKFEAKPGNVVHYRVLWKQTARSGSLEIVAGRDTLRVPFTVTYGLYHAVESLAAEAV